MSTTGQPIEEDPAWRMLQKPAKLKKYISPEKLQELIDEAWQE
jgi:hypothetical protein